MGRRWLALVASVAVLSSLAFLRTGPRKPDATVGHNGRAAPAATVPEASAAPLSGAVPTSSTTTPAPVTSVGPPLAHAVAFVGDSLAENLAKGLAAAGRQQGLPVFDGSISGCGVTRSGGFLLSGVRHELSPTCAAWSDRWAGGLRRDRPKVVAIQVGRHEVLDRLYNGRWTNILDPQYRSYVRGELELGIRIAKADGARVALLTSPLFQRPARPGGGQWPENDPVRVERVNDLMRELASSDRSLALIDLGGRTSPGRAYTDVVDGVTLRSDGVHYSAAGVEWIGRWLLPQLTALLRP